MNIEVNELDELLHYLETTNLEPHDDYTSEFTYKDQKILYKYIKDLQQEKDKYKSIVEEVTKDIKHLVNVIEKNDIEFTSEECEVYEKWLDKIKELEEGNSND